MKLMFSKIVLVIFFLFILGFGLNFVNFNAHLSPMKYSIHCPINYKTNDQIFIKQQKWEIASYGSKENSLIIDPINKHNQCILKIIKTPLFSGGNDWRIGFILDHKNIKENKEIKITFKLRASKTIIFDNAYIYTYDGVNFVQSFIKKLRQNKKSFIIKSNIRPNKNQFQIWLRLVASSKVSSPGSIYIDAVEIEFF